MLHSHTPWFHFVSFFTLPSLAQRNDPVNDFCRRFGHQTAILGQRLFIDGGLVNWNPPASNITNKWLLYNDLTTSPPESGVPILHSDLAKDSDVPFVSGGTLWSDPINEALYLFGGEFSSPEQVESSSLWSYHVPTDSWSTPNENSAGISIPERVAWGASTTVTNRREGYVFGGWQSNVTISSWKGAPRASTRMLKYDLDANIWANNSGPDSTGRAEGAMVYLPASDGGLLVYFGGVLDPWLNGTTIAANMSVIHIYDIVSQKWYIQNATGEVPEPRRRFCADVTWAVDQSSYNVYLYGGASVSPGPGFDDVYILTMPSFRWIRWWTSSAGEGKPHHSLTCNVVELSQMIIIGGTFPLDQDSCDTPHGTHNLKLGGSNESDDWVEWKVFDPDLKSYRVPGNITDVIGGGPEGGATLTSPDVWDNQDVRVYFNKKVTPIPLPTMRDNSPELPQTSQNSSAAVIGGSIGGAIALTVLVAIVWICVRRQNRRSHLQPSAHSPQHLYPPQIPPGIGATGPYPSERTMPTELDSAVICDRKPGSWNGTPVVPSPPPNPMPQATLLTMHHSTQSLQQPTASVSPESDRLEFQGQASLPYPGRWTWESSRSPSHHAN